MSDDDGERVNARLRLKLETIGAFIGETLKGEGVCFALVLGRVDPTSTCVIADVPPGAALVLLLDGAEQLQARAPAIAAEIAKARAAASKH